MKIPDLPTPCVTIDLDVVDRNLKRLADYARGHRLKLRPHTKTHKMPLFGKQQIASGCWGLAVAKVGEAEVMAEAGLDNLLLAYPVVTPNQQRRAADVAKKITLTVALDHIDVARGLSAAAVAAGSTIGILPEQDVGVHRVGVQTSETAAELAQQVDQLPGLKLAGLACYPGHIWDPPEAQAPRLKAVDEMLKRTLDLYRKSGLCSDVVSGGSTPTAYQSHHVSSYTEIRSGTYIFNDMNTTVGGFCKLEDCALRIQASVVSIAVPGQIVLDSGSKTLTSDRLVPDPDRGHGYVCEVPQARITKLSEEHAQVDIGNCAQLFKIGQRLTIIPNHVCVVVNMQNQVHLTQGERVVDTIPVAARGMVI